METLLVETVGLRGGDHDPTGGAALLGCLCDRELEPCAWVTAKNIINFTAIHQVLHVHQLLCSL